MATVPFACAGCVAAVAMAPLARRRSFCAPSGPMSWASRAQADLVGRFPLAGVRVTHTRRWTEPGSAGAFGGAAANRFWYCTGAQNRPRYKESTENKLKFMALGSAVLWVRYTVHSITPRAQDGSPCSPCTYGTLSLLLAYSQRTYVLEGGCIKLRTYLYTVSEKRASVSDQDNSLLVSCQPPPSVLPSELPSASRRAAR